MIERRRNADTKIRAAGPNQQSPVFMMSIRISNYRIQDKITHKVPPGALDGQWAVKQLVKSLPNVFQHMPGLSESLGSVIAGNSCRKHFIAMAQLPDTSRKGFRGCPSFSLEVSQLHPAVKYTDARGNFRSNLFRPMLSCALSGKLEEPAVRTVRPAIPEFGPCPHRFRMGPPGRLDRDYRIAGRVGQALASADSVSRLLCPVTRLRRLRTGRRGLRRGSARTGPRCARCRRSGRGNPAGRRRLPKPRPAR